MKPWMFSFEPGESKMAKGNRNDLPFLVSSEMILNQKLRNFKKMTLNEVITWLGFDKVEGGDEEGWGEGDVIDFGLWMADSAKEDRYIITLCCRPIG